MGEALAQLAPALVIAGQAILLRTMLAQEKPGDRRKDLLYELAQLLEDDLGIPEAARQVYLDILDQDPQDPAARKLLRLNLNRQGVASLVRGTATEAAAL